jgi:hypothetical protein
VKILFLVLAEGTPDHMRDLKTGMQTWAKEHTSDIQFIFLKSGGTTGYSHQDRNLTIADSAEYDQILKRTILSIPYILKNFNFDFLIRCNVSTYFNIPKLLIELESYSESFTFGGFPVPFKRDCVSGYLNYFVSGAAIIFSRQGLIALRELNLNQYGHLPDDVAISDFMIGANFEPTFIPRGDIGVTHTYSTNSIIRCKSSNIPFAASQRMFALYQMSDVHGYKFIFAWMSFCVSELRNFIVDLRSPKTYLGGWHSRRASMRQIKKSLRLCSSFSPSNKK